MLGCEKGRASKPVERCSLQRRSYGCSSQRGGSRYLRGRVSMINARARSTSCAHKNLAGTEMAVFGYGTQG